MSKCHPKTLSLFCAISALAACGGGGGGGAGDESGPVFRTPVELTDTTAGTSTVATVTLSGTGATASVGTGTSTFNHAGQSFEVASTTISADTAGLTSGLDYVASVATGSASAAGSTKLVAWQANAANMPTTAGTLSYTGKAIAKVSDGTNIYDAEMDAAITADILAGGGGTVDVALSNVAAGATLTTGGGATSAYTAGGSESVTLSDATISGATFSGGLSAYAGEWNAGGGANVLTGTQTINSAGVFTGPQAEEVAGAATASGSTGGWYNIIFAGGQ